jgi:hypothetical protein
VGGASVPVEDRHHFFAYASHVMRSVIVDFARARQAERRGGDAVVVALDTDLSDKLSAPEDDVLRVHDALEALAKIDEGVARVVEMRYFGGLTEPQIADALGLSERLYGLGFELGRLKTGTPARLDGRTIDWAGLEMQKADETPSPVIASATARSGMCDVTRDVHKAPVTLNSLTKPVTPNFSCRERSFREIFSASSRRECCCSVVREKRESVARSSRN